MATQNAIIRVKDVKKKYRLGQYGGKSFLSSIKNRLGGSSSEDDFWALKGVSFDVMPGETLGIIGHNGAGKSTLLKLLSRTTAPSEGSIELNGRVASMLEVGTGFVPEMTGRENIYMNGAILGMNRAEIDSKLQDIISFSECEQFIDTPVKRYSSGMYVKLAFSVAAHLDTEIMIMDEVLAVGDARFQKKCLDKMRGISEGDGRTILYVSHNMNTVRRLCRRCAVMNEGRIAFMGGVEPAIAMYMNQQQSLAARINLTPLPRLDIPRYGQMQNLTLLDREQAVYQKGEKMRLRLSWRCDEPLHGVLFRFVVKTAEEIPVGMAMTKNEIEGFRGQQRKDNFEVDITSLTPGQYTANIALSYIADGVLVAVDFIPSAFRFEINEGDVHAPSHVDWISNAWGSVSLPEIQII